jgi:Rab-like protein 3
MAAIDKVRILVVGDSGVGKTSLTHLICHNEAITSPSWTVGCSVEVKLHEFKEGLPQQKTYFVELWDVGGSSSHRNTRSIFYNPVNGIILVHDLTNRKSQQNLQKWLSEIINHESSGKASKSFDDFDPEQFLGSTQIPILVIGTKLDLAGSNRAQRAVTFAEECGADEILLNCRQPHALAAGSSSAVKLTRFFDKVIEKKFYSKTPVSPVSYADKRRPFNLNVPGKYYHND